ncbi:uncharacterized protein LOC125238760 isoform X2 [Leguminivora glycinivorella]|uniref:uncharacterized protein LOC125238760 isoform X2 n=1 Tax=Leguminivora glycinivorella TaxID=1035111 RepID=UPI00200F4C14|nr:uncharacterized protein LOC125238760 isoform X2 [Leguminivora glycinivorella]
MECMEGTHVRVLRSARTPRQVPGVAGAQANRVVIGALNADCWRLVLGYLSVRELMRTEAACRDWQRLVLDDISRRPIMIMDMFNEIDENTIVVRKKSKIWPSFKRWLKKCGRAVQSLSLDCQNFSGVVELLRDACPNLEILRLWNLKSALPPTDTLHFQRLELLTLETCLEITDACVSQFLTSGLQELTLVDNKRVTGRFLRRLRTPQLERLVLTSCRAFKFSFLLESADRLTNLTSLVLRKRNHNKIEIRDKLHLLVDKMPNLESLIVSVEDVCARADAARLRAESDELMAALCRRQRLYHLDANFDAWDQHLQALATSCEMLGVLRLRRSLAGHRRLRGVGRRGGAGGACAARHARQPAREHVRGRRRQQPARAPTAPHQLVALRQR